jgi:hypothetical protein
VLVEELIALGVQPGERAGEDAVRDALARGPLCSFVYLVRPSQFVECGEALLKRTRASGECESFLARDRASLLPTLPHPGSCALAFAFGFGAAVVAVRPPLLGVPGGGCFAFPFPAARRRLFA